MGSWSRRTCSIRFTLLIVLVLLAGVLATGSRVRSKKHHKSPDRLLAARWQSRASSDVTPHVIHESAVKPAPFSKPSGHTGSSLKRSYYVPTAHNLENKLHHFINNLKTGIGSSKLAHAVNGVTGAFQQSSGGALLAGLAGHTNSAPFRPGPGYYGTGNELRYGQPFAGKQPSTAGHFKPQGYGHKRRPGYPKAAPPGKYDSLMSDLGISGYKHFENAVIRDLERREELKVEATIHTLFPEAAADDDWRPITSNKKPTVPAPPTGPEFSETKVLHSLAEKPAAKKPTQDKGVSRPTKPKHAAVSGHATSSLAGSKSVTVTPPPAAGQKHRTKGSSLQAKEKRTKETRTKCWNCSNATTAPVTTRHPATSTRLPIVASQQTTRFGPTYDAAMFYGSDGKPPATLVGAGAHSYSNVEVHYNRTAIPPFLPGPWTPQGTLEVSTQSAPPVTTLAAGLAEVYAATTGSSGIKKSFSKLVKPYGSLAPQASNGDVVASTTTHRPTGGSQVTKGTKGPGTKKRTTHKSEAHRRPASLFAKPQDSAGAGSVKSEVRVRKKFDPKYSRNRGSIKFMDALRQNPDQDVYR